MQIKISEIFRNRVFRQTIVLYAGFLFFGGCVFLGNTLIARNISSNAYGFYQLITAIIVFSAFFFDFGFSATGARILAIVRGEKEEKGLLDTLLFIFLGVCLIYLIVLFFTSFIVKIIYGEAVYSVFSSVIFFAFLYPFFYFFPSVFQGQNKIGKSVLYYFLQGLFFLLLVIVYFKTLSVLKASLIFYASFFLATLSVFIFLRPSFRNWSRQKAVFIFNENKRYGFHVYIGNVVERTSFYLDKLLIGFFMGTEQVAYYSLGLMLIALMTTLSMALNQSLFKFFASTKRIPDNIFLYNTSWILGASVLLYFFYKPLIVLVFGINYLPVTNIMPLLILAGILQSLYQPYQTFLASKGVKEIKTGSYISASINVVFNFALIPFYGYFGAVIATCFSYLAWYLFLRHLYLKLTHD